MDENHIGMETVVTDVIDDPFDDKLALVEVEWPECDCPRKWFLSTELGRPGSEDE